MLRFCGFATSHPGLLNDLGLLPPFKVNELGKSIVIDRHQHTLSVLPRQKRIDISLDGIGKENLTAHIQLSYF